MGKTAIIIGATGLVGKQLLSQLLENNEFSEIKIFVRRESGISHSKLKEYIIDFNKPEVWKNEVIGDVLFSTMGRTLKTAGSKEKQYKVDFSYQYWVAEIAANNGIPVYVLVSSAGASSKSSVFYSRMKGELDDAVSKLNFRNITILRPSILDGDRNEKRNAEKISIKIVTILTKFILKKYRPIKDEIVALAMVKAVVFQDKKLKIFTLDQIFELANL